MEKLYQVDVKYNAVQEDGMEKRIVEQFLVEAISYTDAETNMLTLIEDDELPMNSDSLAEIVGIKPTKIVDIVENESYNEDGNTNDKVKLSFVKQFEKTSKIKKTITEALFPGEDIFAALELAKDFIKDIVVPVEVESVVPTKYVDVFLFKKEQDEEE